MLPAPVILILIALMVGCNADKTKNSFRIIAYYAGPTALLDSFDFDKVTHIIFSFGHLKGNLLDIANANDTVTIQKMVELKSKHPSLKVLLSLGGWGGCETCSDVFDSEVGRREFANSVKELTTYFKTDGIDLDWEYPAIQGPPGHTFRKVDRDNFTKLVRELREVNGHDFEISFAAGGFETFIEESVDWKEVVRYTNFINVMTYDLVHGYSKVSGHHTPLFSTPKQQVSSDEAVRLLLEKGVPKEQIILGAAFYGRYFRIDEGNPIGLFQPCNFSHGFSNRYRQDSLAGFSIYWDSVAAAPYAIHEERRLLATYDDEKSVALKTGYVMERGLGGIMFWQMCDDAFDGGLLDVIRKEVKGK